MFTLRHRSSMKQYEGSYAGGPNWAATVYGEAKYEYDVLDRLDKAILPDNSAIDPTYNTLGRKTTLNDPDMGAWSYGYDAVGNVRAIIDGANSSQKQCFIYDELNRLKQGYTGLADCTDYQGTTGNGVYNEQYTYFANGNLDHKKIVAPAYQDDAYLYAAPVSGCTTGTPATKPHAVRQAGSNTYGYDCNGNMTGRTVGGTSYTLNGVYPERQRRDAENRLTGVSGGVSASFVYDGDGNRVKATVGGVTTLYPGRHYEYVNSTTYAKYYHAGGDLVAFERSSGYGSTAGYGRRFVFRDHLGSTSAIVNGSNSVIGKDLHRPYGDVRYQWRSGTTALQTTYRYTGQRMEVGVGAPSPVGGLDRGYSIICPFPPSMLNYFSSILTLFQDVV